MAFSSLRGVDAADVYKGDRLAGSLIRHRDRVEFRYAEDYLDDPDAPALAWTIPRDAGPVEATGGSVPPFFAGLLPEGIRLRAAIDGTKTSPDDHFTILLAVGADAIGDVRVLPAGLEIPLPSVVFDPGDLVPDLHDLFGQISGPRSLRLDPRGLPGVQAKVSALEFSVPIGTASGSAILKLAPQDDFPQLVENENFFMSLARECGVPVADHRVLHDARGTAGLLVTRFDRTIGAGGEVVRIAQEDACQVLGLYPAAKYRMKTEVVIAELARRCEAGGGSARLVTLEALRLVAYSYAIGNGDLHGKNFSIYAPDGRWALTPAYDLLCTQPYLSWRDPMALDLYGRANKLTRAVMIQAAERLSVPRRAMDRALDRIVAGVSDGIERISAIGFADKHSVMLEAMLRRRISELS
ncbi:type II toxin-antitoxin system HipA family toxin [Nocardia colli]|uniref:type II toxin-antitoxin system HipA family toxin n=1 Tax=Nocardia colli TaxID=2545717 RepID=UPI0035D81B3C